MRNTLKNGLKLQGQQQKTLLEKIKAVILGILAIIVLFGVPLFALILGELLKIGFNHL